MRAFSAGFLIKSDDKYLLCRAFGGKENWGVPKGHVEDGETSLDAAYRETYEETSIDLKKFDIEVNPYIYQLYSLKKKDVIVFFAEDKSGVLLDQHLKCLTFIDGDLEKPEIDKYVWVTFKQAKKIISKGQKDLFCDNAPWAPQKDK